MATETLYYSDATSRERVERILQFSLHDWHNILKKMVPLSKPRQMANRSVTEKTL